MCKSCYEKNCLFYSGEKPFACPHCNKKFGDQSNYRTHLRRHEAKRPYRCDVCDRGFERLYEVRRHKAALHDNHQGDMECVECKKVFKRLGSYRKHIAICGLELFQKSPSVKKVCFSHEVQVIQLSLNIQLNNLV